MQVVGVWMRLAFQDFRHDDKVGKRCTADILDRLHLKACPSKFLGKVLRVDVVDFYIVVKPAER